MDQEWHFPPFFLLFKRDDIRDIIDQMWPYSSSFLFLIRLRGGWMEGLRRHEEEVRG